MKSHQWYWYDRVACVIATAETETVAVSAGAGWTRVIVLAASVEKDGSQGGGRPDAKQLCVAL